MTDELKPKKRAAKPRKTKAKAAAEPETLPTPIEDPIGDVTDGEARTPTETAGTAEEAKTALQADLDSEIEAHIDTFESAGGSEPGIEIHAIEEEPEAEPAKPVKLDRLQKILAQAGIASRRKAEELIEGGRVQVNGQMVSTLGAKADPTRDHIRVDGKLLHGAERHRYFMLNKPKGFVTTVSDPEGRPTVMEFFHKMPERLYPVGRLDYLSEGLLLVTNDGELANQLTRAASGVEKTYLVKVAGQPTEEELDQLRGGVSIDRGKPGEGRVHATPVRVRQVRQGDNPWYEVVLVEGRNRELRKMFEEIGHFVEKIRRVGYGPLVLDLEPGKLRELDQEELTALRDAAAGKKRPAKRDAVEIVTLPTVRPRATPRPRRDERAEDRPSSGRAFKPKPFEGRKFEDRPAAEGSFRPKKPFGKSFDKGSGDKGFGRSARPQSREGLGGAGRTGRPFRSDEGTGNFASRPPRPAWQSNERPQRPARFQGGAQNEGGQRTYRPREDRAGENRGRTERPFGRGPTSGTGSGPRSQSGYRPASGGKRPFEGGSRPARPFTPRGEQAERPFTPRGERPARPFTPRGEQPERPARPFKPRGEQTERPFTPRGERPARPFAPRGDRPSRPFTPRGEQAERSERPARPFTPRGDRPSRPFSPRGERPAGNRPATGKRFGSAPGRGPARPGSSEGEGFERKSGSGWKPKTRFGGPAKPASGGRSSSRPGQGSSQRSGSRPSRPGFKPRPGGGRPGGRKRD